MKHDQIKSEVRDLPLVEYVDKVQGNVDSILRLSHQTKECLN